VFSWVFFFNAKAAYFIRNQALRKPINSLFQHTIQNSLLLNQLNMQKVSTTHIAFASFIGTAIEFYDFYIYAMAAALVIGQVFFPTGDPATQSLNAFLTFGIAFVARPVGAVIFGHFGDKVGRKTTLAASLLLMGVSTLLIGLLPGYDVLGIWAPIILCILRFGQGLGLGGEWGGAALLAT
jgi:MFS family permease